MASISGSVTIAGDPDDWIATAFDASTHAFAGVAAVSGGAYEITGLTAGKAYVVSCRPKTGAVWQPLSPDYSVGSYVIPTNPVTTPYIFKATAAEASGDPNFASVVWLLHCEGENNSTTFTDVAGHTTANNGDVKISTAQFKFGSASATFDGSGDYISFTDSADFDVGTSEDFTFEAWIRPSTYSNYTRTVISIYDGTSQIRIALTNAGKLFGQYRTVSMTGGTTVTLDAWQHVALCRASNVIRLYLGGVEQGTSGTLSTSFSPTQLRIGVGTDGNDGYAGYIDEIRATIGHCRYTSAFTPPVAAFPDESGQVTGATEPAWDTTPGNTTEDDAITWTNMGQLLDPLIAGPLIAV